MPRQSKSKTTDVVDTPVSNTPLPVVTEPVVKVAKAKKPKAESEPVQTSTSTSTSVPVQPVVVSVAAVEETTAVEDVEASIAAQSVEFMAKLNQLSSMIASLKTEYRSIEKKWTRELKAAQKSSSKKKKRAGNRAPSGFVKPTKISDELAKFLEKPTGTEMARTDVTREINKYIRSHNLQDVGNGRKINPDQKLQTLLKLKKTDELTYFNLQRYMSPHFQKSEKALAATVSA
jgi:chromatin remodeling complex protein RSC6